MKREREIEAGNASYIRNLKKWLQPTDVLTIEHHGKENYSCIVIKTGEPKQGKKEKIYSCYKFNPERSIARSITIHLTYTKSPTLPEELEPLAEEYTYEDLLQRSQRVLDSLYIKDG